MRDPPPVAGIVETDIPPRLDQLRWSRFHWLVVLALGITWILDGLEVTLAGAVSSALKASPSLHLSDTQVGASASAYLAGAVLGALFFGWLPRCYLCQADCRRTRAGVHGRVNEAEQIVAGIERAAGVISNNTALQRLRLHARQRIGSLVDLAVSLFQHYPRRAVLGLVLMTAQAFFYNAIFFTYALVLSRFYAVPGESIGLYLLPFAISNFLGPLALGWLFDSWGRRPMITATYAIAGLLLGGTALLFVSGQLNAFTLTIAFAVVFFFASIAASSAYLTVSECFPLEVRALAIAVFYAMGTALGGIAAPWVFGALIGTGDPHSVAWGYAFAAALMIGAALVELWLGVAAECRALEDVARPLSSVPGEPTEVGQ